MSRSDNSRRGSRGYPRRGPGFRVGWRRPVEKAARTRARVQLAAGQEPPPLRHRHATLWGYW